MRPELPLAAFAAFLFGIAQAGAASISPTSPGTVSNAPVYEVWWSAGKASGVVEARAWEPVSLGRSTATLAPAESYGVRFSCGGKPSFVQMAYMTNVRCGGTELTVEATKRTGF